MYNHFDRYVPIGIVEKLSELADEVLADTFCCYNPCRDGEAQAEIISGVPESGYIPFQDGGYRIVQTVSNGLSSGSYLSDGERIFTENLQKQCEDDFLERYDYNINYEGLTEDAKEVCYDYENNWFMEVDTLIEFECWSKDANVYLRLSINYKDCPYFRNQYAETLWEKTMTHTDFLECDIKTLVKTIEK